MSCTTQLQYAASTTSLHGHLALGQLLPGDSTLLSGIACAGLSTMMQLARLPLHNAVV